MRPRPGSMCCHAVRILFLLLLIVTSSSVCNAVTRHYYIAAEDVTWDYAPSGQDLLHGRPIPLPWAAQLRWKKTRYIEYTDATFSVRKPQPVWLGIMGPIIRAEVGDVILVDFLNRGVAPHSIHPHGLRYDKANEGTFYLPVGTSTRVPPGGHFTYRWFADEGSGPGPGGATSTVWWYHAHIDESTETNAGLLGPIIVTAKGKANPDGSPKGVDREFVAMFMVFDELTGKNAGLFHSINGYIFGNLPGLVMKNGEKVRWYVLAMGNERDLHTPHWHGKTVQYGARNVDVLELLPGSMVTVDMVADNPGTWLFHCHVSDHMESGMMATYTIYEPSREPCPLRFVTADFWTTPGNFSITVKNVGNKPIMSVDVSYDHLMTVQYRRRPFNNKWSFSGPIEPGQEKRFDMPGYLPGQAQGIQGWAVFPKAITYSDSKWYPKEDGQCFQVFWRDQDHPELTVLPPVQVETKED